MLRKYSSISVVLVLVLLLLSVTTGCGGGGGGVSTSTPEETVMSMFSALNSSDIDNFARCWVPKYRDIVREDTPWEDLLPATFYNIQTSLESITGDWAEVHVEYDIREDGGELEHESELIYLERIGNEWLMSIQRD